ncbi:DUF72 domain-containing protein [Kaistella polysaccharea]|uniref:DUF72 domain-containing protein n=1 Tax=Kaistella polysaccharea TaxID=2878534 RepID=UPI001CF24B86|nr:DUF72 domain-containing protein [Kaistella polysaccharea]
MKTNKLYIGCSSFSVGYWKGIFYPENLPSKDYLSYYAAHLKAIEINSTFYRKPTAKTLEKWKESTPDDFKFFIKIPKTITHISRLEDTFEMTANFCKHIADGLQDKLAGFLFQLSPSFKNTPENLEKVVKTVDHRFLNVVEFRHESWWNSEIQNTLKENNIIFCGVSIPKNIPDDFISNNECFAYYRLHGVPEMFKSSYSEEQLQKLANDLENFKGTLFIFFNNTYGTAGIKNALHLQHISSDG